MMRLAVTIFAVGVSMIAAQNAPSDVCAQESIAAFYKQCCMSSEDYISIDDCVRLPSILRPQTSLCQSNFAETCTQEARVQDQADDRDFEAYLDECLPDKIIMETERGEADVRGRWRHAQADPADRDALNYRGDYYLNNNFRTDRNQYVRFNTKYLAGGVYNVYISYAQSNINSQRVPLTIVHKTGVDTLTYDQTQPAMNEMDIESEWAYIGTWRFQGRRAEYVEIGTADAGSNRLVIADAIRFERVPCTTTQEPTTEEEVTTEEDVATTEEAATTEEEGTVIPREDCIFNCKTEAAACRDACGPRETATFLCRVQCKLDQNECEEPCQALPPTVEPTGDFTTTTRGPGPVTTTTRRPDPVTTTTRRPDPVTTTTRGPGPVTTTTRRPDPVTTTTQNSCSHARDNCRCKTGAEAYYFTDSYGCYTCGCRLVGSPTQAPTTQRPTERTTTTEARTTTTEARTTTTEARTTTTTQAPTRPTQASTTRADTTTAGCSSRPCNCNPATAIEVTVTLANGCTECRCVRK